MSNSNKVSGHGRVVVDLIIFRDRVSLHVLLEQDEAGDSNRILELSIDPALGSRDLNWRLIRDLQKQKQLEIDQQTCERALSSGGRRER